MFVQLGMTILLPTSDGNRPHLWVVITPPTVDEAVIVNITTKRERSDLTVVLNVGDHPFIKHPSVVYYSDARITPVVALENAIKSNYFRTHQGFAVSVLSKIQKGIFVSEFTPRKIKMFCRPLI